MKTDEDLSSDSSSDEETITEDDGSIDRLEAKLMANPYDYAGHEEYIARVRSLGDTERLRSARETFHRHFPLTASQWQRWVSDELPAGDSTAEAIATRAVWFHPLPQLWSPLLRLRRQLFPQQAEADWETALSQVGLHPDAGELWDDFREWSATRGPEEERRAWHRMLAVPQPNGSQRLAAYQMWEEAVGGTVPKSVQEASERANLEWEKRVDLETEVAQDEWMTWLRYLKWEEEQQNPARSVVLYERCLATQWRSPQLWDRYLRFLERTLPQRVLETVTRATATCGWDGSLWARRLRAAERAGKDAEEIERETLKIEREALAAPLNSAADWLTVWLAVCDFHRRQMTCRQLPAVTLRERLSTASEWWATYFPDSTEEFDFRSYRAALEARVLRDMDTAREQWEAIMKKQGRFAQHWLEYTGLERAYGSADKCRSLWKRACHCVRDYPFSIVQGWVQFEREEGTIAQFDVAYERYLQISEKEQEEAQQVQVEEPKKGKRKAPPVSGERVKRSKGESVKHSKSDAMEIESARHPTGSAEAEGRTVFVVNAPYRWDEERLEALLSPFGKVESVRVVREGGRSKGYAYIDFSTLEEAKAALELNGQEVEGRTLKVVPSEPRSKPASRDSGLTVYVSQLPLDVDEELLRNVFDSCGAIDSMRIVKDRQTGSPKGFAYIDFQNEEGVKAALSLSGSKVKGSDINVQRSKPKVKERPTVTEDQPKPKLFKTPRPRATLVPRTIKVPATQQKPVSSNEEFRKKFLMK